MTVNLLIAAQGSVQVNTVEACLVDVAKNGLELGGPGLTLKRSRKVGALSLIGNIGPFGHTRFWKGDDLE